MRANQARSRNRRRNAGALLYYGTVAAGVCICAALIEMIVCGCIYVRGREIRRSVQDVTPPAQSGAENAAQPVRQDERPPQTTHAVNVPNSTDEAETPAIDSNTDSTGSLYVFGEPLAESEAVDDTWFDSAVFLGDSRTEGLQLFSGLTHGDFYWNRGMSVFRADSDDYRVFDAGGEKVTLLGTLRAKKYSAVYLMLGINELGYSAESYEEELKKLVDGMISAQPDAVIYLQTMPPVNDSAARSNDLASYENNANVDKFNQVIRRVAKEKRTVLLDTASVYRGPDGQLPEDMTRDGVHFTAGGYKLWADYLRTHTISQSDFAAARDAEQ